jgi:hypothetical protein
MYMMRILKLLLRRAVGAEPCGTVSLIKSTNQPGVDRHRL